VRKTVDVDPIPGDAFVVGFDQLPVEYRRDSAEFSIGLARLPRQAICPLANALAHLRRGSLLAVAPLNPRRVRRRYGDHDREQP